MLCGQAAVPATLVHILLTTFPRSRHHVSPPLVEGGAETLKPGSVRPHSPAQGNDALWLPPGECSWQSVPLGHRAWIPGPVRSQGPHPPELMLRHPTVL